MANFDESGVDRTTYPHVTLTDLRAEGGTVTLQFDDWDYLKELTGGEDLLDHYYINGYGVEGILQAARLRAGLPIDAEGIVYCSEGSACMVRFKSLDDAEATARRLSNALKKRSSVERLAVISRANGFCD